MFKTALDYLTILGQEDLNCLSDQRQMMREKDGSLVSVGLDMAAEVPMLVKL